VDVGRGEGDDVGRQVQDGVGAAGTRVRSNAASESRAAAPPGDPWRSSRRGRGRRPVAVDILARPSASSKPSAIGIDETRAKLGPSVCAGDGFDADKRRDERDDRPIHDGSFSRRSESPPET
jgi:hypothetical protein